MDDAKRVWSDAQRAAAAERMRAAEPWRKSAATGRGSRRRFAHQALHDALAGLMPKAAA